MKRYALIPVVSYLVFRAWRLASTPSSAPIMSSIIPKTVLEHFNKAADNYELSTGGATRELAEYVLSIAERLRPITAESKILDNACGTGIVTDVILNSSTGSQAEIHVVDAAEGMVNIARDRFASNPKVHAAVMPGEELSFPDGTFTHSITNLGLMFFNDPNKGASEIARTLHPEGVAVVTGWMVLGHARVIQAVQAQIRPDEPPFSMPISKVWFDPEHTRAILSAAGLDVQVSELDVHMGGETADYLVDILSKSFAKMAFASWTEEEKARAVEVLKETVDAQVVPFSRSTGSGVGVKMRAIICVARKAKSHW